MHEARRILRSVPILSLAYSCLHETISAGEDCCSCRTATLRYTRHQAKSRCHYYLLVTKDAYRELRQVALRRVPHSDMMATAGLVAAQSSNTEREKTKKG